MYTRRLINALGGINTGLNTTSNTLGNIITTGGNIGIGTTAPSQLLTVAGTISAANLGVTNISSSNFNVGNFISNNITSNNSFFTNLSANQIITTNLNTTTANLNQVLIGVLSTIGNYIIPSNYNSVQSIFNSDFVVEGNINLSGPIYSLNQSFGVFNNFLDVTSKYSTFSNFNSIYQSYLGDYILFIPGQQSFIQISTDYGTTFNTYTVTSGSLINLGTTDYNCKYITVSDSNSIWNSDNYGVSFTNSSIPNTNQWNTIKMSGNGNYQLTSFRIFNVIPTSSTTFGTLISTDYGKSFNNVNIVGSSTFVIASFSQISFALSYTGKYQLAIVSNSNAYLSTNFGTSWNSISSLGTNFWQYCDISKTGQYQVIVSSSSVYFSKDYGLTWSNTYNFSSNCIYNCKISASGQFIVVFCNGNSQGILYSSDYGFSWTQDTTKPFWGVNNSLNDGTSLSKSGKYIVGTTNFPSSQVYKVTHNLNADSISANKLNAFIQTSNSVSTTRLDVFGNQSLYGTQQFPCYIFGNNTNDNAGLILKCGASNNIWSQIQINSNFNGAFNTAGNISFWTASTQRMRIVDNGYVGINTDSPSELLHVGGNLFIGANTQQNYIAFYGTYGDIGTTFIGERIYGGLEQSELLLFKGNDNLSDTYGPDRIRLLAAEHRFDTHNGVSGAFDQVATSGTTRMIVTNTGQVGINQTSPNARLEINSSDAENTLFVNNQGGGFGTRPSLRVLMSSASGARNIIQAENSGGIVWKLDDLGNVTSGSNYCSSLNTSNTINSNTIFTNILNTSNTINSNTIFTNILNTSNTINSNTIFTGTIFSGQAGIGITSPSYQLQLSTDSAAKPNGGSWANSSDERLKENIEIADLNICYDIIKNLPLKRYKWKENVYTDEQIKDRNVVGWIAQDVKKVFPKAVETKQFTLLDNTIIDDCLSLNETMIMRTLYGAVQKLICDNEILKNQIKDLQEKMST